MKKNDDSQTRLACVIEPCLSVAHVFSAQPGCGLRIRSCCTGKRKRLVAAWWTQKVHSNVRVRAYGSPLGRSRWQYSQLGRIVRGMGQPLQTA